MLSRAVLRVTEPQLPPDQTDRLTDIVYHHLPASELVEGASGREEMELVKAVEEEMRERHLQIQPEVTKKVSPVISLTHSCTIQFSDCAAPSQSEPAPFHRTPWSQEEWYQHMLPHTVCRLQTNGETPQ